MNPEQRKQSRTKWLLLGLLLLLLIGGGIVLRAILGPAEFGPSSDKVPMVAAALRGRVEYLDPLTAKWKVLRRGDFLWEGSQIRVHEGGALTAVSDGMFSFTIKDDALLAIRRASRFGDGYALELGLDWGRLIARLGRDALGSGLKITTGLGEYTLDRGATSITSSPDGDRVFVSDGNLTASVDGKTDILGDGDGTVFGPDGAETDPGDTTDDLMAIAEHSNTVGSADGGGPDELDLELEKKKLALLIWSGLEDMAAGNWPDVIDQLAPEVQVNGIPTSASDLGGVVTDFVDDHTTLDVGPDTDISVTIEPPPPPPTEPPPVEPPPTAPPPVEPPPAPPPAPPPDLSATVVATTTVLAEEETEGGVVCGWKSSKVTYVFKLKYINGSWKIVALEVATGK